MNDSPTTSSIRRGGRRPLRPARQAGAPATPSNGCEAPFDKERFANARAKDYWNVRGIFETGEIDIDKLDDVLAAQLGRSRGRLILVAHQDRVEGRHAYKHGLPSPDRADTLALVMSRRATGGAEGRRDSHQRETITGDLMQKAW